MSLKSITKFMAKARLDVSRKNNAQRKSANYKLSTANYKLIANKQRSSANQFIVQSV